MILLLAAIVVTEPPEQSLRHAEIEAVKLRQVLELKRCRTLVKCPASVVCEPCQECPACPSIPARSGETTTTTSRPEPRDYTNWYAAGALLVLGLFVAALAGSQ